MSMPLRILIVEDSDEDELILVHTLQSNGYDVTSTRVETAIQMDAALELNVWDIILCNYCLPNFNALEALQLVQNKQIDLPIIIVSGTINEEMAVGAMKAGAHDFVTKTRLARLVPAIQRELKEAENRRYRKQTELAFKQSEEQLQLALEANHMGTWDWNISTNKIICSTTCERLFDLAPGTGIKFETFMNCIHPQDREAMVEALNTAWQLHQSYQYEYRVIRQNGSIRWIQAIGNCYQPVGYLYGIPNRMLGIVIDITEQKLAEQKIYEQAALLDVATDAIFLRTLNGTITYWNKGAERLFGWTAEEVINKNAYEFLYREQNIPLETVLKNVIEFGKWQGELNKITKNNQDVIVFSRWTLVEGAATQGKYILTVDTDITAKKQLESQFLRTQRLENLGVLASGIAHDLNNILTPILAVAQLLSLTLPNITERNQQMLQILESSAKRGADLVKQILSFARGNNEKRLIVQVKHLLLDIEKIAEGTFPKSIELKKDLPDNLWTVSADPTQLHQVFMNLVINARDAMPHGGTLTITAKNQVIDTQYTKMNIDAQEGKYVLITFSDTGIGISKDIIDKIFDPFFTTKEVGKGTGLGLSTVFNIIKNHDGFIEVSSNGQGSVFKVFLPTDMQIETISKEDTNIVNGNGELILFVDDEKAISEVTKNTLETHNYQVMIANNGIEAIANYVQNKLIIKAVIMDLIMPTLDGVTTIQALRKIMPDVKIIAMSGSDANQEKIKATEYGVQDFVSKPFTANVLLNTLQQILTDRKK
jgi:PAS domain S-box-containing protein